MPELTPRGASLLRFLEVHADADNVVIPPAGSSTEDLQLLWSHAEGLPNMLKGGHLPDDFPEILSELVLKGRVVVTGYQDGAPWVKLVRG
jgi:hypothetical protein